MQQEARYVAVDPVTDEVLWICSGADAEGKCPIAETPPYVCQGLRLNAVAGTDHDGHSVVVDHPVPGRCPARDIA